MEEGEHTCYLPTPAPAYGLREGLERDVQRESPATLFDFNQKLDAENSVRVRVCMCVNAYIGILYIIYM